MMSSWQKRQEAEFADRLAERAQARDRGHYHAGQGSGQREDTEAATPRPGRRAAAGDAGKTASSWGSRVEFRKNPGQCLPQLVK